VHNGIILSQKKYANDLLHRVNMQICKTVDTPLYVADKLSLTDVELLSGDYSTNYRCIVGALQYIKKMRPTQALAPVGIFYKRNSMSAQREYQDSNAGWQLTRPHS
jgi:hypothetical protein